MIKSLVIALGLALSLNANATTVNDLIFSINQSALENAANAGFDWKVGDSANYSLNMGFIKGSMAMAVKEITADVLTLTQDMDLGFAGKQACEMKLNPTTGEALSLVCNGQNQQLPGKDDTEIVDIVEDTVKVPAGTFTCLHIIAKQKSDGKQMDQWANPKAVPVMGLIKALTPGPFGQVTIELTAFKKN